MIINIRVMLKEGGYRGLKIDKKMMGELAVAIMNQGFEYVTLESGSIEIVVGFMVTGDQVGERVIITGDKRELVEK